MTGFRMWELRSGKVPLPIGGEIYRKFQVFEIWEKKLWEGSKLWSMHFLSLFLRLVIILIDKMRKQMRLTVSKMEETLTRKNVNKELQGASSFFLKDIAEHMKKIRLKKK